MGGAVARPGEDGGFVDAEVDDGSIGAMGLYRCARAGGERTIWEQCFEVGGERYCCKREDERWGDENVVSG